MKKTFLHKVMALFLSGAVLTGVGCSDYDDDIASLNTRIDELTTGKLASLEEQAAALKSSIGSLEAAYKAADSDLRAQLTQQASDLAAAKTALEQSIAALQTKHNSDVQTLQQNISKVASDLAALGADLNSKITGVDQKVDNLSSKVESYNSTLTASINKVASDLAAVSSKLSSLESTVSTLSQKHDADVARLEQEITSAVAAVKSEVLQQLAADKAELQGQITAAVERIAALESSVATIQGQISTIQGQISSMETAIAGKVDQSVYDAYTQKTDAAIQANAEALGVLQALCAGFPENTTIKEYIDGAIGTINASLNSLEGRCTALENNYTQLSTAFGEFKTNIEPRVKANEDAIEELKNWKEEMTAEGGTLETIDKRLQLLEDNQLTLEDVKSQFDANVEEFKKGVDDVIAQALAEDGVITAAIAASASKVTETFQSQFNALAARVAALEIDVDEVMNRIQSLVYVPAYNDHKATVGALYYAPEGEDAKLLASGTVTMTFRATPVEAAQKLITYYNGGEENHAVLTLEIEEVKTRGNGPALKIESITYDETKADGRFVVVATPVDFPDAFFSKETGFSAALRLNKAYAAAADEEGNTTASGDTSGDIVSDYVNLVPGETKIDGVVAAPVTDGVIDTEKVLENDDYKKNSEEPFYDQLAYDDVDGEVADVMAGYEPCFQVGDNYYTIAEMQEMGFDFGAYEVVCTSKAYKKDSTEADTFEEAGFKVESGEEKVCDEAVRIDPENVDKTHIGNYVDTAHAYSVSVGLGETLGVTVNSRVVISRTTYTSELSDLRYAWNYSDYSAHYKSDETKDSPYEGATRTFVLDVLNSKLPAGIEGKNIYTYWGQNNSAEVTVYLVDGEEKTKVEGIDARPVGFTEGEGDAADTYEIEISGYKFGATYEISMKSTFQNVYVEFRYTAQFIGLPETVEYDLGEQTLTYDASVQLLTGESEDILDALYEKVEANIPEEWGVSHYTNAAEFKGALVNDVSGYAYQIVGYNCEATAEGQEPRIVTSNNHHSLGNSNPGKDGRPYSCIRVKNDDMLPAYIQVNVDDVDNYDDVFSFLTEITPEGGLTINVTGKAAIEMPKYAVQHIPAHVALSAEGQWYSKVRPKITPDEANYYEVRILESFSVEEFDFMNCFQIVKLNDKGAWEKVSNEEIEAQKLAFAYSIPESQPHDGIKIEDNTLSYKGYEPYVQVNGALSINGVELPSAFKNAWNGNDYTNYIVEKFDPIRTFQQIEDVEIEFKKIGASRTENICKVLSLRDRRNGRDGNGYELIDHSGNLSDPWVVGNGTATNGFAVGTTAGEIYSLKSIELDTEEYPAGYTLTYANSSASDASDAFSKDMITVDATTGDVVIKGGNEELLEDVNLTVYFKVSYPWAYDAKNGTKGYIAGSVTYKILH